MGSVRLWSSVIVSAVFFRRCSKAGATLAEASHLARAAHPAGLGELGRLSPTKSRC
jgi:hypothetical protein